MPRMSDAPLTVGALAGALTRFHREVLLPDIQRVVGDAVGASEGRQLDRLETESAATKIGLKRLEERLAA
jgi:hypothetical protein